MNKINDHLIWYMTLAAVGGLLLVLAETTVLDSFWSGMGVALIVLSALRLIQIVRYKKDEEYAEKKKVKANDERNRWLAEKARAYTFYYSILAECIAVIISCVVKQSLWSNVLSLIVSVQLVIYWSTWLVLKKKF